MLLTKLRKLAERIEKSARCRKIFIIGFIAFPIFFAVLIHAPDYVSRQPPGERARAIVELVVLSAAIAVWQWGAAVWAWPADRNALSNRLDDD
jgi:hypothetical protein